MAIDSRTKMIRKPPEGWRSETLIDGVVFIYSLPYSFHRAREFKLLERTANLPYEQDSIDIDIIQQAAFTIEDLQP
jgi:hypothetical protein